MKRHMYICISLNSATWTSKCISDETGRESQYDIFLKLEKLRVDLPLSFFMQTPTQTCNLWCVKTVHCFSTNFHGFVKRNSTLHNKLLLLHFSMPVNLSVPFSLRNYLADLTGFLHAPLLWWSATNQVLWYPVYVWLNIIVK